MTVTTHAPRAATQSAVRHPVRGKSHLLAGVDGGTHRTACGRELVEAQVLPWGRTAPEDRCARCTREADAR